jgi:hypothetical protein
MHLTVLLIEGAVVFIIGGALGYVVRHYVAVSRRGSVESDIEEKLLQAKRDARLIEDEALTKARELREEMKRTEDRIVKQEERLDKREQELIKKDILRVKQERRIVVDGKRNRTIMDTTISLKPEEKASQMPSSTSS